MTLWERTISSTRTTSSLVLEISSLVLEILSLVLKISSLVLEILRLVLEILRLDLEILRPVNVMTGVCWEVQLGRRSTAGDREALIKINH